MQRFSYELIEDSSKLHPTLPLVFHTDTIKGRGQSNTFINFNWHENIEILTVLTGRGTLHCDTENYDMEPGDVMIINSSLLHSTSTSEQLVYHCMIIDSAFCKNVGVDTAKLQFKTRIQDPELHAQLISAAELLKDSHESGSNSRYARAMARLLDALAIIAEKYPLPETEHKRGSLEGDARIKRTIDYISNNVTGPLTLDALAAEIGISKFHLSREFKRMTGLTIFDFIILLRLKLARRLMREGLSVSESALSAGFENLSYFSRKFREVNGQLPSEYAAKYSSKNAKSRKN